MLAINQETTARENFEYLKQSSFDSNEESKNFTTSSLNVQARLKKCVFSKYEDSYSDQCKIVTNANMRREILKKENICFKCLKPGHIKRNCRIKIKCFRCKVEENHHIALCCPSVSFSVSLKEKRKCLVDPFLTNAPLM